jgi:Zn-dependent metalloprotease
VYIDAQNNKVLKRLNRIYDTDYIGTAHTFYNGIQSITTNKTSVDRDYYLMEEGRSGLRVLDCKSSQFLSYAEKIKDFDNIWNDPDNYKNSCYDVHYSSEKTYDYFLESHNRNSLDNNGYRITSYVNFDYQLNNAFWDGEQVCYGSGDNIKYNPFTSTDIVAHELTHGITTFSANLNYEYESGALNESFSDIFSVCVDFYANPGTANWTNGEQVRIDHFPFRSIKNPNLCDDPDTYNGLYWYAGSSDNGGVHTNSGVQNYWFYLLVNGGIGINDHGDPYNISGIGLEKAAQIAYRNLTVYLTPTSNYEDARTYSIQAAGDLFGECSNEAIQVTNAWNAVGVGAVFQILLRRISRLTTPTIVVLQA